MKPLRRTAGAMLLVAALGMVAVLPAAAQTVTKTVKVGDNFFKPKKIKITVGTKLTFKWVGSARHDVKVKKGPQKFESKLKNSGKFSRTINKPGKYLIYCTIHPGMEMKMTVSNPPPATTTTSVYPPPT